MNVSSASTTISLKGELVPGFIPVLEGCLDSAEAIEVEAIVLDLRRVSLLDRSAAYAIVAARDRIELGGHQLIFRGLSPSAQRLIRLSERDASVRRS